MIRIILDKALGKIPDGTGLILHYYQGMPREKGVRQGMSRIGLLKSELLYLHVFNSMEHFKKELLEYLDFYSNRRIKAKRKGLPPALHRQQALLDA